MNLPNYDSAQYGSFYDALGLPASSMYHQVHIILLSKLYVKTGESILKQYHDKWEVWKEQHTSSPPKMMLEFFNNLNDNMGNVNGLVSHGTLFVDGVYDKAVRFNSTAKNFIEVPNNSNINVTKAVSVFVQLRTPSSISTNAFHPIFVKGWGNEHYGYKLGWDNRNGLNTIWWEIGDGNIAHYNILRANVNWHPYEAHSVAATYNGTAGTMMKIYVDGKLVAQGTPLGLGTQIAENTESARIGGDFWHLHYSNFNYIDDLQVYDKELSQNDIGTLIWQ